MILAMNKDGELEEYKEPVRYDNSDELAYNGCYTDEKGNARYRDYELDIDIRKIND